MHELEAYVEKDQQKKQDRARNINTRELDASIQFVFQNDRETLDFWTKGPCKQ